jgi:hypothetical protein
MRMIRIRILQVDQADPVFPRPTNYWWFGCQNVKSSFDSSLGNVISEQSKIDSNSDDGISDYLFDAGK